MASLTAVAYETRSGHSNLTDWEDTMAETGKMACWMGLGKGFEIREYPVPEHCSVAELQQRVVRHFIDACIDATPRPQGL